MAVSCTLSESSVSATIILLVAPVILKPLMVPTEVRTSGPTASRQHLQGQTTSHQCWAQDNRPCEREQAHVALRSSEGCHKDPLLRLNSEPPSQGIQATIQDHKAPQSSYRLWAAMQTGPKLKTYLLPSHWTRREAPKLWDPNQCRSPLRASKPVNFKEPKTVTRTSRWTVAWITRPLLSYKQEQR